MDAEMKFWGMVLVGGDCWEWIGGRNAKGYGVFRLDGRQEKAHRVAWMFWNGPIEKGLFVCHHCDNPGCVRPVHLFTGTNADNLRDMTEKGRRVKGDRHGMARLTEDQALSIREDPRIHSAIAADHGISRQAVSDIKRGVRWAHLPPLPQEESR